MGQRVIYPETKTLMKKLTFILLRTKKDNIGRNKLNKVHERIAGQRLVTDTTSLSTQKEVAPLLIISHYITTLPLPPTASPVATSQLRPHIPQRRPFAGSFWALK